MILHAMISECRVCGQYGFKDFSEELVERSGGGVAVLLIEYSN